MNNQNSNQNVKRIGDVNNAKNEVQELKRQLLETIEENDIKEIQLETEKVRVDTSLKLKALWEVKKQGLVTGELIKDFTKVAMELEKAEKVDEMSFFNNVSDDDMIGIVYATYLNANWDNHMDFDDFISELPLNFMLIENIYSIVMLKNIYNAVDTKFADAFKKVTPKTNGGSKKKYRR